ncbi:hypothetical protein B9Z55_018498 [Caenorhabditis nigoni]|uniref:7TM GPCR serpentine receptor class x (Srx) domain-containing protein n=1 Tax=Caenorhabditis nigoni TaxID=1611254 RepID=A0A2G5TEL4_9PELO|nr:hypothetical protein B9Z55_018498 [Caenorhabditis nigoni]
MNTVEPAVSSQSSRAIVTLTIFLISLTGLVGNFAVFMYATNLKILQNSFGRLSASQSFAEAVLCAVFLGFYCPMVLFEKNTRILIGLSYLFPCFTSIYMHLANDCLLPYVDFGWYFGVNTSTNCDIIRFYVDFCKDFGVVAVIAVVDVVTIVMIKVTSPETIIWIFLFGITVLTIFLVSIVRLRAIARHNSIFHFNDKFYYIFTFSLALYILVPMPFCWISSGSTPIETQNFVKTYYPNAMKVLDVPGVFIYTDAWKFRRIIIVAVGLISTAGCLYVFLCQAILYEIRRQCRTLSSTVLKYHRKAMKDTIVQIVILGIFLGATPCLQILNAYRDPEADTITATIIINAIFVSSPIPYAITVLYQNSAYRRYIVSMLHFRDKPKTPRVGSTIQISIVPGNNSPRSPQTKNRQ